MKVRQLLGKAPVTIADDATLKDAAALMDKANVGALLVMDGSRLAGIVTDRDLVVRALARGLAPEARIDGAMTTEVVTVAASDDIDRAYEVLARQVVRRLPVLDDSAVVGMITVDDLLVHMSDDIERLVRPIFRELAFGHHPAPVPAVR